MYISYSIDQLRDALTDCERRMRLNTSQTIMREVLIKEIKELTEEVDKRLELVVKEIFDKT